MSQEVRCQLVRGGSYEGKQGLSFGVGISAESAGSRRLCLHTLAIPPGGRAQAHLHADHESAVYVVSGQARVWSGEDLSQVDLMSAGDFMYIPAGVPHLPANASNEEPLLAVVARTDPNEQESVVLLPNLEARAR